MVLDKKLKRGQNIAHHLWVLQKIIQPKWVTDWSPRTGRIRIANMPIFEFSLNPQIYRFFKNLKKIFRGSNTPFPMALSRFHRHTLLIFLAY